METIFKKLPSTLRIGKHCYKIELVVHPDEDESKDGIIFFDDRIEIRGSMSQGQIESTLFHEIFHGIAYHYGIKLTESMVLRLEEGLYEVFKKNGWSIKTR